MAGNVYTIISDISISLLKKMVFLFFQIAPVLLLIVIAMQSILRPPMSTFSVMCTTEKAERWRKGAIEYKKKIFPCWMVFSGFKLWPNSLINCSKLVNLQPGDQQLLKRGIKVVHLYLKNIKNKLNCINLSSTTI